MASPSTGQPTAQVRYLDSRFKGQEVSYTAETRKTLTVPQPMLIRNARLDSEADPPDGAPLRQLRERGFTKLGLVGTPHTMKQTWLLGRLRAHGLEVLVPESVDDMTEMCVRNY